MSRDYVNEMNAFIDEMTPATDYVAPLVAHDVVEKLRVNDLELLEGWLDLRAEVIMADHVHQRLKSRRNASRASIARSTFAGAAENFSHGGDASSFREAVRSPFSTEYVVNDELLRRRVGDMTGADHLFVAQGYADSKQTAALLESFHRAVGKKVGKKQTRDVFTEQQYLDMYQSITRRELAA